MVALTDSMKYAIEGLRKVTKNIVSRGAERLNIAHALFRQKCDEGENLLDVSVSHVANCCIYAFDVLPVMRIQRRSVLDSATSNSHMHPHAMHRLVSVDRTVIESELDELNGGTLSTDRHISHGHAHSTKVMP